MKSDAKLIHVPGVMMHAETNFQPNGHYQAHYQGSGESTGHRSLAGPTALSGVKGVNVVNSSTKNSLRLPLDIAKPSINVVM